MDTDEPFVTADKLKEIFVQTMGSIRGSAGMVLWCWATSNMSFDLMGQTATIYASLLWFILVSFTRLLIYLNKILVSGRSSYKLNPDDDIVVISGGSNGLGLLLLAMFSADGFTTVNLDIVKPAIDIAQCHYYQCDVSDPGSIPPVLENLLAALKRPPSVLINCAGTVANSLGPFQEIDINAIRNVIDTNLIGSIYTTQQFLSVNPRMKMIVGISSSTALVGPAYAGIYAASKSGVYTFFESLRQELKSSMTRVLCVVPGQLDTAMFQSIETPSQFWAPVSKASDVATYIYKEIKKGRQGVMAMPMYSMFLPYILLLPQALIDILRAFIGVDVAARSTD